MSSFGDIFKTPRRRRKSTSVETSTIQPTPSPSPSPIFPPDPVLLIENVNPLGMSYWRNINYHAGQDNFLVAVSVGNQLRVLTVNKNTLSVTENRELGINHTGEGIYFSVSRHDTLYVPLDDELITINVFDGSRSSVWKGGKYKLWQIHSSYSETVHSATLRDDNYNDVGWGVFNGNEIRVFDIRNTPDECQIDKSGEWLLIKETNDAERDEYNRFIHLPSGDEKIIHDQEGAIGHSDCGFGCVLGENNFSSKAGALDMIEFASRRSLNMFSTGIWNMGYFSFTNARNEPIATQFGLITTPNELIKVRLDGSGIGIPVCGNLTESQNYEHRPKANLCPLGEYAVWSAFVSGVTKVFVVRVP